MDLRFCLVIQSKRLIFCNFMLPLSTKYFHMRIATLGFRLLFIGLLMLANISLAHQPCQSDTIPFTTGDTYFKKWDGRQYQPFFIKGINLGVAVPGTQPSQMAATRSDYIRWISSMREAGFNNIRVYTLHFPDFYEVLDSINQANPNHPIHIFQGVWLEEELEGYENDLYQLTELFNENIEEIVDVVHGNRLIDPRPGQAFGNFTTDVSPWVMGYIIGREVHPVEIITTDSLHQGTHQHQGEAISLPDGTPSEAWIAARLDHLVIYERSNYGTERPVSFSSWPTLDPLTHPTETHTDEDIADFDVTKLDYSNAPAGIFATYHAYPYYPDFISNEPFYQTFFDYLGPNSYLGYLTDLKNHYHSMPLIIGEFGTSSSWGIAHFAHNGIYHGGMDELDQGLAFIRMMENVLAAGCGGGMMFSWIDEWFKRTWITDPFDFDPARRILWHNITAAEQNFGLIRFQKPDPGFFALHEEYCDTCLIHTLSVKADYTFFHVKLGLQEALSHQDTIWLALDTYDAALGESILPSGDTVASRAEFAMRITPYSAELYVTQAYDLYGIWHGISGTEQLFRSIPTDGAPWKLVRWKTNSPELDVHYIGQLQVRRAELPPSSHDGVIISDYEIHVRLPWSLINFHDPSQLRVIHDYRDQPGRQDTLCDGIRPMAFFRGFSLVPENRFAWEPWNHVLDVEEVEKVTLDVLRVRLPFINNPPIAYCMEFSLPQDLPFFVDASNGLLSLAIDLDGNHMQAFLTGNAQHGMLNLLPDGSFMYSPEPGFSGMDVFRYKIFDGRSFSQEMSVGLEVFSTVSAAAPDFQQLKVFPNPASERLYVQLPPEYFQSKATLYGLTGHAFRSWNLTESHNTLGISGLKPGAYVLRLENPGGSYSFRVVITHH
jgi:hypothetical protein